MTEKYAIEWLSKGMHNERGEEEKKRNQGERGKGKWVEKYMMCTPAWWEQTAKLVMEEMQIYFPWALHGRITPREAECESCQPPAPCDLLANIQFNKKVLNIQKAVKVS